MVPKLRLERTYKNGGRNDRKSEIWNNAIITFDVETTSYCPNPDADEDERRYYGCMYHWQFCIDGIVYRGRLMSELYDFLLEIQRQKGRKIIWVHNLSFEFQWLQNIFEKSEFELSVFARTSRKPIKVSWGSIDFRCTYMLTNMSLAEVGKAFNLPVHKMEGDLDYHKLRGYTTPLSEEELKYCDNDVLVVYHLIRYFLKLYQRQADIPLTSTGRIRRACKKIMVNDKNNRHRIEQAFPDAEMFAVMRKCFYGGYTHSNYTQTDKIIEGVDSFDIASSYPTVMVAERFPLHFVRCYDTRIVHESTSCRLYHIKLYNVEAKGCFTYLSKAKCECCYSAITDNGRILSADWVEIFLTDIDLDIVMANYAIYKYEILECWRAPKRYLPKLFLEYIFKLYEQKTALKNVEGMENEYMQSKAFLNSLYGMCVTNDIRDEIEFDKSNGEWTVRTLSMEEIDQKLKKQAKSVKTFLLYQWGLYITAYARRNLWYMIRRIDDDCIYVDTDSIKIINAEKYIPIIDEYNAKIKERIEESIRLNRLEVNYPPVDKSGVPHPLGVYEHEKEYPVKKFKTLGAKKYCYLGKDDKLHITVSGVTKKAAPYLQTIENFKVGFIFPAGISGRTVARYINEQKPFEFIDCYGIKQVIKDQKYAINLEETTYEIGLEAKYSELIHSTSHLGVLGEESS